MEQQITNVGQLIDLWGTLPPGKARRANVNLASDLRVPVGTVRSMRCRNAIARKYWPTILESARKHALDSSCSPLFKLVTAQLLVDVMINPPKRGADSSAVVHKLSTPVHNASASCNTLHSGNSA